MDYDGKGEAIRKFQDNPYVKAAAGKVRMLRELLAEEREARFWQMVEERERKQAKEGI